jgi:indolepyruvate ferredoxin oxidoreductase beta subunit
VKKDIAIVGVGGQGSIFATNVLCQYAMARGLEVLGTETIGAAQRGGSVISHMRISDRPIYSPLIPKNRADVLLGLEALELLRCVKVLHPSGYYIMNSFCVPTVYSNMGIDRYPSMEEIVAVLKKAAKKGYEIPATRIAAELGDAQMTNVVMLGALAKVDDFFEYKGIRELVENTSPPKFLENNMAGFEAGYGLL